MVDTTAEPSDLPEPRFECDIAVAVLGFREFEAMWAREADREVKALRPSTAQRNAERAALCGQVANTLERLLTLLDDPAVLLSIPQPAQDELMAIVRGKQSATA